MMNNLLLFPLLGSAYPFGYFIAGICLIAAIVLFIISIFMKDSSDYDDYDGDYDYDDSDDYDGDYDDENDENENENYTPMEETQVDSELEKAYYNIEAKRDDKEALLKKETVELKNLVAGVTGELGKTRSFRPITENPIDENESDFEDGQYENPVAYSEKSKDETQIFRKVSENSEDKDIEKDNDNSRNNKMAKENFNEEFSAETEEKTTGLSFAEEVRRLIAEEEKRK